MLFNSIDFALFFPIVFFLYWFVFNRQLKHQNFFLLISSYFFYGCWNWKFLFLILLSTIVDYFIGKKIYNEKRLFYRKLFLSVSIFTNLGILAFFKYSNFFIENFVQVFLLFGNNISINSIDVILPVGISFYTFQTMSYTVDVYRKKNKSVNDFIAFASFVSFFPQLVAGPIERSYNLLPQILNRRKLNNNDLKKGTYLILYGLFIKIVIADNLAFIVDSIFSIDYNSINGALSLFGIYAFAFQIYCDFSGYSSIARGVSKFLGFHLMVNFKMPYFSTSPSDFWSRWHISLSSWLRDYLYIPLGGNRYGKLNSYKNVIITMTLGGLWHGASWNFIFWGLFHSIIIILFRIFNMFKLLNIKVVLFNPRLIYFVNVIIMFHLICLSWFLFRSENIDQVYFMVKSIIDNFILNSQSISIFLMINIYIVPLIVYEYWLEKNNNIYSLLKFSSSTRFLIYIFLILIIIIFHPIETGDFIYFQF